MIVKEPGQSSSRILLEVTSTRVGCKSLNGKMKDVIIRVLVLGTVAWLASGVDETDRQKTAVVEQVDGHGRNGRL